MSAADAGDRSARRLTAPESRTSNALPGLAGRPLGYALGKRLRPRPLAGPGFTNLGKQSRREPVRLCKQVEPAHFRANGSLQDFRGRKTTFLHEAVEVVGQIDLHAGHTPTHTPLTFYVEDTQSGVL